MAKGSDYDAVFINHHMIQEGDTYGLVNSLVLNKIIKDNPEDHPASAAHPRLSALLYVNADRLEQNKDYAKEVAERKGYFGPAGLTEGSDYRLVYCHFQGKTGLSSREEGGQIHVDADPEIFNSNPRRVSIALTDREREQYVNDPDNPPKKIKQREKLQRDLKRKDVELGLASSEFRTLVGGEQNTGFGYIDYSTDYVSRVIGTEGSVFVSSALRSSLLETTKEYSRANQEFMEKFMGRLLNKKKVEKAKSSDVFIVLFWIRGARASELNAILGPGGGDAIGKPQHHTNMVLYKYVRHLIKRVAEETGKRFLVVPIGDKLKELGDPASASPWRKVWSKVRPHFPNAPPYPVGPCVYKKSSKGENLIKFFARRPFTRAPRAAQMNFLLQLSEKYQVIQIGMRSGSLERLMQVGVPTIYFDRTGGVTDLPDPVGHARIRQLSALKAPKDKNKDKGKGKAKLEEEIQPVDEDESPPGDEDEPDDVATKSKPKPKLGPAPELKVEDLWKHVQKLSDPESTFTAGFPLFFHVENVDTGMTRYSGRQGTKVDRHVDTLLERAREEGDPARNRQSYNELKQRLASTRRLPPNDFAKEFVPEGTADPRLVAGGLSDTQAEMFRHMLWAISEDYDRKNDHKKGKEKEADNVYSKAYEDFAIEEARAVEAKKAERAAKKAPGLGDEDDSDELGIWFA